MMKHKGVIILLVCLWSGITAQAQYYHFPLSRLMPVPGPEKYYLDHHEQPDQSDGPGIQYSFLVQSGFFSSGYGNGWSYSITPGLYYKLSPRFSVSGGVSYTFSSGNIYPYFTNSGNVTSDRDRQVTFFIQGTYAIRPDLYLTGTVVKNLNNQPYRMQNPYVYHPGDRYSLKLDYFLSKSIRLSAEFGYRNDQYPAFFSPYTSPYTSPYLYW